MARCNYWDCGESVSADGGLCDQHDPQFRAGLIDSCPDCHLHKTSSEETCGDCSRWDKFSVPEDGFDLFDDGEFANVPGGSEEWERTYAEYGDDDEY